MPLSKQSVKQANQSQVNTFAKLEESILVQEEGEYQKQISLISHLQGAEEV